jgi:HSP20 family protein
MVNKLAPLLRHNIDPFRDMEQDMRTWPVFFRWPFAPDGDKFWEPTVEVAQTGDNVIVTADLPGMKKEEVKVRLEPDSIVISGERKSETESKEKDVYMTERVYGTFSRRLALPTRVDVAGGTAKMDDGVLTVTVPRAAPAPASSEVPIN